MKKVLLSYIIFSWLFCPVFALTVDDSVDLEIKNTYKTDIIERDLLPKLPSFAPSGQMEPDAGIFGTEIKPTPSKPQPTVIAPTPKQNIGQQNLQPVKNTQPIKNQPFNNQQIAPQTKLTTEYKRDYKEIKLKKGTKFKLRIKNSISDSTPRGTRISFVSVYPETSRYITIPSGTIFKGTVTNSHSPQLFGNGGLIELKVDEIVYNNAAYYIDTKVGIADYKRVYLNNIKGKQTYLKSMSRSSKPGKRFMKKMCGTSSKLTDGPEMILIPVAILSGAVVYGMNLFMSPVLALFSSGGSIRIPSGSYFEIKLREDAIIKEY